MLYALTPHINIIPDSVTVFLFLASHILVIYLVYTVLTKGIASEKTFDDGYWYEDRERMSIGNGKD